MKGRRGRAPSGRSALAAWLFLVGALTFGWGLCQALRDSPPEESRSEADLPPPESSAAGGGRLAIVIDDCGQSYQRIQGFLELEQALTMAVLPHLPDTRRVAEQAALHGHCVMLHLPMQSTGPRDPGPGALRVDMGDDVLLERLRSDLDAVPQAVGLNNHEGSLATGDPRVMELVLAEVARRELFYLDSRTTPSSVAPEVADRLGVPLLSRNVFLDNVDSVEPILDQLRRAEELAAEKGAAVAIGHPRPNTLEALRRWIPEADARGVHLVPLAHLLDRPAARRPETALQKEHS